jgi:hypothetical protein
LTISFSIPPQKSVFEEQFQIVL